MPLQLQPRAIQGSQAFKVDDPALSGQMNDFSSACLPLRLILG